MSRALVATMPRRGRIPTARTREQGRTAALLFAVTRPRILALVVASGLPVLALGVPFGRGAAVATAFLALALVGASCSAFNAWIERERDALMERTRSRPLPSGSLSPGTVLGFACVTGVAGPALLLATGSPLAAGIAVATLVHYVVVYTAWLKPRTPWNIVVGGAAGATSPLIVDAAATGALGAFSVLLFAIVVVWTPPHFWSIACHRRAEYEAAGIPMLPCVVGPRRARASGLGWALLLPPLGAAPAALGIVPAAFGVVAVGLGCLYVAALVRAMREDSVAADRRAFRASVRYLAALVACLAAGAAVA